MAQNQIARSAAKVSRKSAPAGVWERVITFIEHPLFLTAFSILGGALGLVYPLFWALFVVMMLLTLHRTKGVSDQKISVQIFVYLLLLIASSLFSGWLNGVIKRNLHIPTANQIADVVVDRLQHGLTKTAPTEAATSRSLPVEPPSDLLLSLFMGDHNEFTGARSRAWPSVISRSGREVATVFFRVNYDQDSRSKFILIYVPKNSDMTLVLKAVVEAIPKYLTFDEETPIKGFTFKIQGESEPELFSSYPFSGRAYVYYEGDVSIEELGTMTAFYKRRDISVEFLGSDYMNGIWSNIRLRTVPPPHEYSISNGNIVPPLTYIDAPQ